MKCTDCSRDIPDGAKYCPWCGKDAVKVEKSASWIAGMQEEITEARRNEKSFTTFVVVTLILGGILIIAWLLLPVWLPGRSIESLLLMLGIVFFVLGLVTLPFVYRYAKKRERLINNLKDGGG